MSEGIEEKNVLKNTNGDHLVVIGLRNMPEQYLKSMKEVDDLVKVVSKEKKMIAPKLDGSLVQLIVVNLLQVYITIIIY